MVIEFCNKLLLILIMLLVSSTATRSQSNVNEKKIDSLTSIVLNGTEYQRVSALMELTKYKNRGMLMDMNNKYDFFNRTIEIKTTPYFIYQSISLISDFALEEKILVKSREILQNTRANTAEIVAALTYLEKKDVKTFDSYFDAIPGYNSLNPVIKLIFRANKKVIELKNSYYNSLIDKYVQGDDGKRSAKIQILAEKNSIVPWIVKRIDTAAEIPTTIILLLGEIGDPVAFNLLFDAYKKHPSDTLALSVCNTLNNYNIDTLLNHQTQFPRTQNSFLEQIFSQQFEEIKSLGQEDKRNYLIQNLNKIRTSCKSKLHMLTN